MTPEEFTAIFTKVWVLPKPEPFLDHFLPLIDANAVFIQPTFPDAHGYGPGTSGIRHGRPLVRRGSRAQGLIARGEGLFTPP
jgi:hypothetical protein